MAQERVCALLNLVIIERNTQMFSHENSFENVVDKTSFILCRPFIELESEFCVSSHCGLVTQYGHIYLSQHWPGDAVLHDGIKTLHKPMLTSLWCCSVAFIWEKFNSECPSFCTMCLTIILLELLPHFPGPRRQNPIWCISQKCW